MLVVASCLQLVGSRADAQSGDFVRQTVTPPPLRQAHTFTVTGQRVKGGCLYQYAEMRSPTGVPAWEVRDIAVDMARCVKIVEQGVPTVFTQRIADSMISRRIGLNGKSSKSPGLARPALANRYSGYTQVWWEDGAGWMLTQDRPDVTWDFDYGCALGGSTDGQWWWQAGTGWRLDSSGGSNTTYCYYHKGETWSSMSNSGFCPGGAIVRNDYHYVRFNGYYNGTWDGDQSSAVMNECLPLYRWWRVVGPA